MTTIATEHFDRQYQTHLKHLKLKGLQPKTIEAYSRAIRRVGDYFVYQIDDLTAAQLTDYFTDLVSAALAADVPHCVARYTWPHWQPLALTP